ncbi:hypothetical protein RRG08_035474 [Elysia crispata]|uniref:2-C-methyl-D-erythritol 4-phosphate cytidylyltransferase, chloroplastic n=1 Tax=Elysia crispata TaxID=231223 RepID=A0AAE1E3C0_9GAST|nr:hypothetical protein RRG08_035474 [Elysia crispata]
MRADVILPAAGSSVRMKMPIAKQFQEVCGHPILAYTIDCFHRLPWIRHIVVVVDASQIKHTRCLMEKYEFERVIICTGGRTRHRSIFCGVQALKDECEVSDVVLIHDGARPFIPEDTIMRVASAAIVNKAAGVTRPLVSTVIRGDDSGTLLESLDRLVYRNSEMPQAFQYSVIADAYSKCTEYDLDFGTECLLLALKYAGCAAHLVEGTDDLWKVTYQKDLYAMESIVKEKYSSLSIINKCTCKSTFVKEVEEQIFGWPFKIATAEESLANTFVVFMDNWTHTQRNFSHMETIVSSIAEKCVIPSDSKISLIPIILAVFVSGKDNAKSAVVTSDKRTSPQETANNDVGHFRRGEDLDNMQKEHDLSLSPLRSPVVTHTSSSPSVCSLSSSCLESFPSKTEKRLQLNASSPCTEPLETNSSCDYFCQNVGITGSLYTDSVPAESDKPMTFSTQRRNACAYALTKLKSFLAKSFGKKSFTVVGIVTEDSQDFAEKLRSLIWHRASYLDGQLFYWT